MRRGEMMARRGIQWTVRLASSHTLYLQDTCRIQATGIDEAAAIGQRILKAKRLTSIEGTRWDMWGVWAARGVHSLPALLAYGTADGVTYVDKRERRREQTSQGTRSAPGPARQDRIRAWAARWSAPRPKGCGRRDDR
jgi:hypothetical protein